MFASPTIRVLDVAYPRFRAPDLDLMQAFLETFGMHESVRTADALYMRGTDADHHVHVTHLGAPAFVGLAFKASSEDDLAALAEATGGAVEPTGEPGGGSVVHLQDPDGRSIEVVAGIEGVEPHRLVSHPPLNTGAERVRIDELQRVATGPSQVKRFGHAALKTDDLARAMQWYQDTLGLLVSDEIWAATPEEPAGAFMRCDRGDEPADHHSLLLIDAGEVKLGHCAWEVADFDDLMAGHDHLVEHGARHYWGIGRHVLGGQIFDYWKDPLGFTVEHWTDSDLLRASVPAGSHNIFDALSQWGPNPPPDLDF